MNVAVDAVDCSEAAEVSTSNEAAAADVSAQPDSSVAVTTEVKFIKRY